MREVWKLISGYATWRHYEVSTYGRVRGFCHVSNSKQLKYRLLVQHKGPRGYLTVVLRRCDGSKTPVRVHVLVALAFCEKRPSEKHHPNHKDLNKQNNHDWNLEWMTCKENLQHYYANGYVKGTKRNYSKLSPEQVEEIRQSYSGRRGEQLELAEKYGVSTTCITNLLTGKRWKYTKGLKRSRQKCLTNPSSRLRR